MRLAAIALVALASCSGPTSGHELDPDARDDVDAAIACTLPVPAATCDPAAHPLPNPACLGEEPGTGGCPPGMVRIAATTPFCIDRYEASLEGASPYWNPGASPPRALSRKDAVPQAYISGTQAQAACVAAGKRLCTDTEWLRACRGPTNTTYPYGNTRMPGVCNDARAKHPAVEYFGTSDPVIYTMLSHPCLDQLHDSLDRSGANPGCVTAEGAFDMMGNLHEWTSAAAGTFRGGFYVDTVANGNGCLYATTAHDMVYSDYSTGFRCCAD